MNLITLKLLFTFNFYQFKLGIEFNAQTGFLPKFPQNKFITAKFSLNGEQPNSFLFVEDIFQRPYWFEPGDLYPILSFFPFFWIYLEKPKDCCHPDRFLNLLYP